MRGRTGSFWGGALTGAALAWWLLAGGAPMPEPPGPPPAGSGAPDPEPAAAAEPSVHLHPQPAPVLVGPPSPFEAALRAVAAYSGDGVIRCAVGDRVPPGPVAGIGRAEVDRGILVGAVAEPVGQARIQRPDDPPTAAPLVVVRWRDAWPGGVGRCEVLDPERVAVTGIVVGPDGEPLDPVARSAAQVGNSVDGGVPLGPEGRFVMPCWRGAPCAIAVRAAPGAPWGPFVVVVPEGPMAGTVLRLSEPGPGQTVREWLEQQVAEDAWVEATPDPLDLALADGSLSPEAHRVVERWLEQDREARALHRELLAQYDALLR